MELSECSIENADSFLGDSIRGLHNANEISFFKLLLFCLFKFYQTSRAGKLFRSSSHYEEHRDTS